LAIGEKLWEGKGKGMPGFIKSVGMEGVKSVYSWEAMVKGMGKAMGVDGSIHVTAMSKNPPKGVASSKDQGIFNTITGDMAIVKGYDLMKMMMGSKPVSVGLWSFMTMSEKLGWMNDLIALITFEALDPMWMEFSIAIWEWK